MYSVDIYNRVRRACLKDGMSAREAARYFNKDRKTIAKMLRHELPPGYQRSEPPRRPTLDDYVGVIDEILRSDKALIKKQRHTSKRIFERLRDEHGFACICKGRLSKYLEEAQLIGAITHQQVLGLLVVVQHHLVVFTANARSWDLTERPIDSLGRFYHRVSDVSLPWSLALAPCPPDEMHERESTAIRSFAPKFNTSIPSIPASEGRMPEISGYAAVFQDQISSGGAFDEGNLRLQMERAAENPSPPWRQGKQRRKTGKREPKPELLPLDPPTQLTGDSLREAWQRYGVPSDGALIYPINLCDDGSVVTRDGEIIGTWSMDQYEAPSFTPDDAIIPLFEAPLVGLLCMRIREWHESKTGEKL